MRKARAARAESFSRDRVHPGDDGHLLMARTILAALGVDVPDEPLAAIKADPLYREVDLLRRHRSARWMQYIGYTREKTVPPQPLGDAEVRGAKFRISSMRCAEPVAARYRMARASSGSPLRPGPGRVADVRRCGVSAACAVHAGRDSITVAGGVCDFRVPLLKKLTEDGCMIEYTVPVAGLPDGSGATRGYGGKNARIPRVNRPKSFREHTADIV
jgi:hypothetical protein